ncbi:MAG: putative pyridoxal-dependent aspartate 1-decarboxylase [Desulfobacteraceae bacterium]|nr:putative pyridoxal-dependent aspartate 1-decarboxylase [Desulfobacteraceae bacterium]MBC2757694.1 putative pyridoxal-dependent aspartate 1-decarboxylase [Desulfobacteraceae bacterium]
MKKDKDSKSQPELVADWESLFRVFIRPEGQASRATLIKYMDPILYGLNDFLKTHVGITEAVSLKELSKNFTDTIICDNPEKKLADVITCLIKEIAPYAVNVASPYFVGHMTSAIPFFMVHLKTIVAALNQNVVKLETSKVVSVVEKQVVAKIHRMIYDKKESFYQKHVQNTDTTLGVFVEGGTTANLTAMWAARNAKFPPKKGFNGIESEGIAAAYRAYDVDRCVILVSRRGHYSLRKAGGVLGIGNQNIIALDTDKKNRVDLSCLKRTITRLKKENLKTCILAIVGIAGATETGSVDPLEKLAKICAENNAHFHVDAAWGGPTLFSKKYKHLIKGIQLADSVTMDGHKQFYMPMSCGMLYLKKPHTLDVIAYHANYVNRMGSVDLGIKTLSGSREANSLILDSALKIMGRKGYALLIDHGIETAAAFAKEIKRRDLFELITPPVLNILTYRVCPPKIRKKLAVANDTERQKINQQLNKVNRRLQRIQREAGYSFVSRTTLLQNNNPDDAVVVLRSVIMNPMTTIEILNEILDEQEKIFDTKLKDLLE